MKDGVNEEQFKLHQACPVAAGGSGLLRRLGQARLFVSYVAPSSYFSLHQGFHLPDQYRQIGVCELYFWCWDTIVFREEGKESR
jgi:hypothetical protein